ncbi:hypothetical protein G7Z17_g2033 [Cylindrodendrum hubeiense]|uniref:Uncharacterized protein n=1 Tax=Cylindrodendrum hubeiense TaxID=595255 RepID=A0A9P5HKG7_9HYPO|nr:hypothetical protein G7Z17_g2033 [Cylindrodendrum hubeiense]
MSSSTDTDTDTTDTATATKLIAVTTPFKQPRECDSYWTRTSAVSTNDNSTSTIAILVSNAVASCYPSGWDDVVYSSRFNFNPAVCPSDWIYYDMHDGGDYSKATCCKSYKHQRMRTLDPNPSHNKRYEGNPQYSPWPNLESTPGLGGILGRIRYIDIDTTTPYSD